MNIIDKSQAQPGKGFVGFSAFLYISLGVLFLINPSGMASGLGYTDLGKSALTDVMATYGGLEIGIGVMLLLLYWNNEIRIALALVFLTFVGFAIGRVLGSLRFGGFQGLHLYWLASEAVYLLLTNYYMSKYRNKEEAAS